MRRVLIGIVILAVVVAVTFFAEQWSFFAPGPPVQHRRATIVWIKPGVRSAQIAQELQNAGVLRSAVLFRLGVAVRGKSAALKAGEYAFPSGASMADVMGILTSGKSIEHKITAAEGLTSAMIYDIVRRDPMLTGNAGVAPAEGSLLPETYLYTRSTSRGAMLGRMARAQQRLLAREWPTRSPGLPFKSAQEAVILASIVEKETAISQERPHVAAVFINRLRLGMKLQSDPTVIYGLTRGYPLGRGIRESELAAPTPYNTYVVTGLPPTPICNPGKASIAAVLHPEASGDLYFVANGRGGHVFTKSIAQHEENVAKWRRVEKDITTRRSPPIPSVQAKDNIISDGRPQTSAAPLSAATSRAQTSRPPRRPHRTRF